MTSTPPDYSQNPAPKGGGKKWVLFGCGGCLGLIALGIAGIVGFVFVILGAIKQTDAYKIAAAKVQNSPAVQEELGLPLKETFFSPVGSTSIDNGAGKADIALTFQGSKPGATAIATVVARKAAGGEWQYDKLSVKLLPSGKEIDLLTEGQAPAPAPAPQN